MEKHFFDSQDAWREARKGLFTSSEMHRLMTTPKDKTADFSTGAITYIREKAVEILAGLKPEFFNASMERGKEMEPYAASVFAERLGYDMNDPEVLYCGVSQPIFYTMANVAGGTPDLVLPEAIAEIKCPDSKTHLDYLLMTSDTFRRECPDYFSQVQCNMMFCERPKAYFVSYDDRFKDEKLQMKIIEIPADADYQKQVVEKLAKAKGLLDKIISQVYEFNK